ncbi:kinase-like protein [Suhomyces tanzawaensis NRRL Y-17324]|uniref:non-specific serine/threonine protein kinase n=1 Tax=Suhomyces tanzawaensis NRRL Y-17324 TaxID=984487 RepID=A0A1E4SQW3_9ASCO|nr:kinase-like protein [Suhomyces tanzawaensis NRRL Y-17324]ODV81891.1 kinase-like protein [Suhomyces tanzawaensis NRRL Y-17324]
MSRVHSADELEVCEEVGRGGFGVVYRGIIKATNEEVAIKQIDLENDQTDLFEINKEIQIISECRLEQITGYLGCFVKQYKLWVIMEFVNGGSLFEMLKPGPIHDERTILIIVKEILVALEYLHNQGKIHRDLKSQNILLSKGGEVKLTDFGVSTQLSSNFSRRNTTVGTPYWMAPEVILNNNGGHSFKADIWSLGCCAYEIFNGKPPLQNHFPPMKALRQISRCHNNEDFVNIIELSSMEISSVFRDFLEKCFIVDPKERFSAIKLLNHKFIQKYDKSTEKFKLVKSLITKKQLWDQENHVIKNHNFYVPTEMVKNQKKWRGEDDEENNQFQFDISLISGFPPSPKTSRESSRSPGGQEKSKSPEKNNASINLQSLMKTTTKQDQFKKTIRPEFHRILNKVFHKLETKNSLTTQQYDLLVSLNNDLLNLFSFTQSSDPNEQGNYKKILVFQHLKYFLKEISKSNDIETYGPSNSKVILQKLIIPSNFNVGQRQVSEATPERGGSIREFDEIENSLFESWIDKMNEKWA